ncbi:hypothetical protein CALCODRAFT_508351 [Calocera cornea HHB12733]|uniref:Uncharacterized protein n=1 Tax=Calocera cornea HHB12733 TaxID=1353952 RepID=A0A165GH55_9BASI|nr:hypothetical protein CALCODRAFT_508351 [Calocera cornea HHB12733]
MSSSSSTESAGLHRSTIGPPELAAKLRPFALLLFSAAYCSLYPLARQPFPQSIEDSILVAQALYTVILNFVASGEFSRGRLAGQPSDINSVTDAVVAWISVRFSRPTLFIYSDIANDRHWHEPPPLLWDLYRLRCDITERTHYSSKGLRAAAFVNFLLTAGKPAPTANPLG